MYMCLWLYKIAGCLSNLYNRTFNSSYLLQKLNQTSNSFDLLQKTGIIPLNAIGNRTYYLKFQNFLSKTRSLWASAIQSIIVNASFLNEHDSLQSNANTLQDLLQPYHGNLPTDLQEDLSALLHNIDLACSTDSDGSSSDGSDDDSLDEITCQPIIPTTPQCPPVSQT